MSHRKVVFPILLLLIIQAFTTAGEVIIVPSKGYHTISKAIVKARRGDTILVKDGTYKEQLYIKDGIVVKAQNPRKAILDGGGRGIGVTLGASTVLDGMVVTNSTIGVFNKSPKTVVKNCDIRQNWMTGVMSVRQLIQLNDNTITFNKGSGIVVWDARSTSSAIEHNTVAFNVGFGMYLGGTSEVVIKNNTVAFNQKYGLKMSDESAKSIISGNNFFENLHALYNYPTGNYSFDPQFRSPRVLMDFRPSKNCCAIRSSDNENLGVRFSK